MADTCDRCYRTTIRPDWLDTAAQPGDAEACYAAALYALIDDEESRAAWASAAGDCAAARDRWQVAEIARLQAENASLRDGIGRAAKAIADAYSEGCDDAQVEPGRTGWRGWGYSAAKDAATEIAALVKPAEAALEVRE